MLDGMAANLHPSGLSQAFALTLFKDWGIPGFLEHTLAVAKFYQNKRDEFLAICEKHLIGLAKWNVPQGGMFVWLELLGVDDTSDLISTRAVEKKVLFVPGAEFLPISGPSSHVRASYSVASVSDMDTAISRLRELLIEEKRGN